MYKSATKCNETIGKWCKTKHGASKIIDTFETYQTSPDLDAPVVEGLLAVVDRVEGLTITEGVADVFWWSWGARGVYVLHKVLLPRHVLW
jgi:hypothetical protein